MIEYFKVEFQKIAEEYSGKYEVEEFIGKYSDFSSFPYSYHRLTIPNQDYDIILEFDFGDGSVATLKTKINNANKSKFFKIKKRNPFKLLFQKTKKSLIIESNNKEVVYSIEKILYETGLEDISRKTLFDPDIKFRTLGSITEVETIFNIAFEDKEKAIKPIIEFYKKTINYLKI